VRIDRRMFFAIAGAGGAYALFLGLNWMFRMPRESTFAELAMPLAVIAGALMALTMSWRGWRRVSALPDPEPDDDETPDSGLAANLLVYVAAALLIAATIPGFSVGPRIACGIGFLVVLLLMVLSSPETRSSLTVPLNRTLEIGADGVTTDDFGLIPWNAIFGVAAHSEYSHQSHQTVWYLVLGVVGPDHFLRHPIGKPFANLSIRLTYLGKAESAAQLTATALSRKRLTGQPLLPGWRADMDADEVTALVERHRRTGTFPG
jgi:hypothetical protein